MSAPIAHQPSIFRKGFVAVSLSLFVLMLISPADLVRAAGLGPPQSNYIRARFSTDQGLHSDIVDDIVQSHDGFLWLRVDGVDLDRFDGQHFDESNGVGLFGSLAVAPNGDLWVGARDDLKQIPADELDQIDRWQPISHPLRPGLSIVALHFTREGVLWVGTNRGLYRFENGVFSPAIPGPYIERIEEAGKGHLWIATGEGPVEWDGSKAVSHPELAARLGVKAPEIFDVLEDSKGVTWFCTKHGVARRVGGTLERLAPYGPRGHETYAVYEDPRGRIWFARSEGLFQLTAAGLQLVAADLKVRKMYGDRDGNLWVSTNGQGLFRFKDLHVRTFTTADGLPNDVAMTVLAAHDGSVWAGFNCGGLAHFDRHGFRIYNEKNGLTNGCVWSLAEDGQHDLWIGTWGGGVFRFHEGKFTQYSKAQGLTDNVARDIVAARDGSIWVAGSGPVSRIRDGRIRNYTLTDGLPDASGSYVYADRQGGIWVWLNVGMERLVNDRFEPFSFLYKVRPFLFLIGEDSASGLYFYTQPTQGPRGIFHVVNNQATLVTLDLAAQELRETKEGDFWLFSSEGIIRIPPGGLENARRQDEPLDFERFDQEDGMPSNQCTAGIPVSTLTPDGRLWIATIRGLAVVDLPRLPKTDLKPSIYVEKVTIGRNSQAPPHELALPAGTYHLELYFDAIEITSPEKIRLQYRLDGVDSEWLDANPPGQAIYSTLPPGKHAFHIRACNRSGIWDRVGTEYDITQEPYFYQTHWFLAAGIAFGLLLIATLYQLRLQQLRRQFDAGLEARVEERTRIARELHDTLLQSFHAVLFSLQAVSDQISGGSIKQQLDSTIDQAAAAITEGRDAVQDLRLSTVVTNDLAADVSALGQELAANQTNHVRAAFRIEVQGAPRDLHPILRDEIYRITGEALRNAFKHAQAQQIEVEIRYEERQLRLVVRDDGKGIDSKILEGEEPAGHFGLRGLRERAQIAGGRLDVWSKLGAGTEVDLSIPASVAYATPPAARRSWFSRKAAAIK
jgi:signal transduction histidine kinase/ligand-binding sensor domain-containing protein